MYTMREDCPIAFATEVVGKKRHPQNWAKVGKCVPTSAQQDARKHECSSLISQVTSTSEAQS